MTNETNALNAFINACNEVSEEKTNAIIAQLSQELDNRSEYERVKNADNDNVQDTLKNIRSKLLRQKSAQMHAVCDAQTSYVNRSERVNARFNVYSLQKIAAIIDSVAFNKRMNDINLHVLRSLFRFEDKALTFTHKEALCAASDKVVCEDATKRKALSRHNVSAVTATTQASSTMNALLVLNVVREARNADSVDHYVLTHNALCEALKEIVMK